MICHEYKCVFVHIPKNAGQSIENVFLDRLNLTWETRAPLLLRPNDNPELGPPRLAHLKADEYIRYHYLSQEIFDDYFKFSFVRNPWSRLVSVYKHLGFNRKCDFKKFLMTKFKNGIFRDMHWFVGPQSNFLYSETGELLVDFVGRFETLQSDFEHVCTMVGLPVTQLPHVNRSTDGKFRFSLEPRKMAKALIQHVNLHRVPVYDRYQDYYDQESIDLVEELYARDIELFKYEFG